ncbi:hypothetical protein CTRI78_v011150 [Colletotrichum trifolii]|uniref:Uncharacterized protein n=1 Tax=Colletotrichum trifolii TaxID=5466 RepID=A0A4R8QEQ0_COLTR|nr:hypothetical protein CTRI78_v011150 [Colletotrichum trifolii]
MRWFNVIFLAGLAIAETPPEPTMSACSGSIHPSIFVRNFQAGGLGGNRNFIEFEVSPTPGASYSKCSIHTASGPVVPTVNRFICESINSVVWTWEPLGNSWWFNVWWTFTSHQSLSGGWHMDSAGIKNITLGDGSVVERWVGKTEYELPTQNDDPM